MARKLSPAVKLKRAAKRQAKSSANKLKAVRARLSAAEKRSRASAQSATRKTKKRAAARDRRESKRQTGLTTRARFVAHHVAGTATPEGVIGAKALQDTGRAIGSQHVTVAADRLTWSGVDYLGPHMTGAHNGRPPKRNPTVFEKRDSSWVVVANMAKYMNAKVRAYVLGGASA